MESVNNKNQERNDIAEDIFTSLLDNEGSGYTDEDKLEAMAVLAFRAADIFLTVRERYEE